MYIFSSPEINSNDSKLKRSGVNLRIKILMLTSQVTESEGSLVLESIGSLWEGSQLIGFWEHQSTIVRFCCFQEELEIWDFLFDISPTVES